MDPGVSLRQDAPGPVAMVLCNEFARVEIRVEDEGAGPALRIRDTESHRSILLDPLELEALTRLTHSDFGPLVVSDPAGADRTQKNRYDR